MRLRLRLRRIVLALFISLVITGVVIWRMTYVTPAWYAPPDARDAQVIVLADRVEQRMIEECQMIRPEDAPWTLRVREGQINAWLAARLRPWIEHDQPGSWPEQFGTPQVRIDAESITIGLPLRGRGGTQTLAARIIPTITDRQLHLRIDRLSLGSIALPGEPVTNLLRIVSNAVPNLANQPHVQSTIDVLAGRKPVDPLVNLADHRRVRMLGLQLGDGWIDVRALTIARQADE